MVFLYDLWMSSSLFYHLLQAKYNFQLNMSTLYSTNCISKYFILLNFQFTLEKRVTTILIKIKIKLTLIYSILYEIFLKLVHFIILSIITLLIII